MIFTYVIMFISFLFIYTHLFLTFYCVILKETVDSCLIKNKSAQNISTVVG